VKPALVSPLKPHSRDVKLSDSSKDFEAKSVRFRDALEDIRYFRKHEQPTALESTAANANPSELTQQFELTNLDPPHTNQPTSDQPVSLTSLTLSPNTTFLTGTISVINLAYEKHVTAHYSFDNWTTVSTTSASYSSPSPTVPNTDLFSLSIERPNLAPGASHTLQLAIQYQAAGRTFWDNNAGRNHRYSLRAPAPAPPPPTDKASTVAYAPQPRARRPQRVRTRLVRKPENWSVAAGAEVGPLPAAWGVQREARAKQEMETVALDEKELFKSFRIGVPLSARYDLRHSLLDLGRGVHTDLAAGMMCRTY